VHVHGPFPAGAWNDLKKLRSNLKSMLDDDEMIKADNGYAGEKKI